MKRRGRPPRQEKNLKVLLKESVFNRWRQRKSELGFSKKTNSQFAEFLLDLSIPKPGNNKRMAVELEDLDMSPVVSRQSRRRLLTSTPVRQHPPNCSRDVDVTGLPESISSQYNVITSRLCLSINEKFASIDGNPFENQISSAEESESEVEEDSKELSRHTNDLENFNSMIAKYAPKRNSFEFLVFSCRVLLAVIDHNMHVFRPLAMTTGGQIQYARKYSKRTKKWHAQPKKVEKEYRYWPFLMANILRGRHDDPGSVRRQIVRPTTHPKNLAPTIAMRQPVPTEELIKFRNLQYGIKNTSK